MFYKSNVLAMLRIVMYFADKMLVAIQTFVVFNVTCVLIQETHRQYLQKMEEVSNLQNKCTSFISSQRKRLKEMSYQVKK